MRQKSLCDAQLSTKATIAESSRPAKCSGKNSKGVDNGITNIEASNLEISKLLVQFPVKHTETSKAPDKQLVAEKAKLVKDFLQNSKLSSLGQKESAPATLLTTTTTESQAPGQKKQLLGLSKICPKTNPDLVTEVLQTPGVYREMVGEWDLGMMGKNKTNKGLFRGRGHEKVWPYSDVLPKPSCLLTMCLTSFCFTVTTAPSDKNSFKYSGNIFAPRFPTNSTTATLNHPFWLNLNFPPPPVFPNHSGFPQFQGLYHQRVRMPYQQTIHPSLGCYSRQVTPYNPQHLFRSPYTPLLNYVPLVHPNYSYQQRNLLKPSSNVRDPPAMAGDGPQYQFPHLYGFNSMLGGSLRTNPYFSSMSGINF
uniref:Chromosome 1 open reading frame 94 n=1 Tax=Crocodylus porosus TaxID=8502 RepID=A0A7M4DV28_CROPO